MYRRGEELETRNRPSGSRRSGVSARRCSSAAGPLINRRCKRSCGAILAPCANPAVEPHEFLDFLAGRDRGRRSSGRPLPSRPDQPRQNDGSPKRARCCAPRRADPRRLVRGGFPELHRRTATRSSISASTFAAWAYGHLHTILVVKLEICFASELDLPSPTPLKEASISFVDDSITATGPRSERLGLPSCLRPIQHASD